MPKSKNNDTSRDESSKSRADSEGRKELFSLAPVSHLASWTGTAVLVLQPQCVAAAHELKSGQRAPDTESPPPHHSASTAATADYSTRNSSSLRVVEKRS